MVLLLALLRKEGRCLPPTPQWAPGDRGLHRWWCTVLKVSRFGNPRAGWRCSGSQQAKSGMRWGDWVKGEREGISLCWDFLPTLQKQNRRNRWGLMSFSCSV